MLNMIIFQCPLQFWLRYKVSEGKNGDRSGCLAKNVKILKFSAFWGKRYFYCIITPFSPEFRV